MNKDSPRDIYEMVEMFEDILFMRTEKFMEKDDSDLDVALSSKSYFLLGSIGITGRIFRRWYQTTWGWNNSSRWFRGETPRMELAKRHKGLISGETYFSVQLVKDEQDNFKIIPSLYGKEEISKKYGIFDFGRSFLPTKIDGRENFHLLPPPNYDPGFKFFVNMLEETERDIEESKSEKLPSDTESRFWHVFWSDACITILLNCELDLSRHRLIEMSAMFRALLEGAILNQGSQSDDYISIDGIFNSVWKVFQQFDKKLLPLDEIISKSKNQTSHLLKKPTGPYSLNAFYNFGNLFDELLLFPADRYFGAVECVWTDQQNFLNDLMSSIYLLKNNLQPFRTNKTLTKEQKKFIDETNIQEKVEDIYRIWFAPPTYFRVLPRFLKYF